MNGWVKRWPGWVALVLVVTGFLAVGAARSSGPQTTEDRIDDLARRVACPVCDGESVFESRNNASVGIRNAIAERVVEGRQSDGEILAYLERRYQGEILLVPRSSGIDALVWALPAAAFVCAAVGLAIAFGRWRREAARTAGPTEADRELVAAALAGDGDAEP
jgi:cytochrome c-type biogenesis protein CcmH